MADAYHPRAHCWALNEKLDTCRIPYGEHEGIDHEFQSKPVLKHHIPWRLLGQDHAYCGRQPHHYDDPTSMQWVPSERAESVRRLARMNVICTACFKNWLYLQNRSGFLGRRADW